MLQSLYTSTALIMALTVTSIVANSSQSFAADTAAQIMAKSQASAQKLKQMPQAALAQSIAQVKPSVAHKVKGVSQLGPSRTGGGNGVLSKEGSITPLEVIFANSNKDINPQTAYPVGYRYFQTLVQKIKVAIPSFAKDIQENFGRLKWIGTTLDLTENSCRNSTGIFRIESAGKQVVVACQKSDGEVYLSLKNANLMAKPEYMGVIFLHETFVSKMMYAYAEGEDYQRAEVLMITKINPYLISAAKLDPKKVHEYTADLGFRRYQGMNDYHPYTLEVFPEAAEGYKKQQALIANAKQLEIETAKSLEEYLKFVKVMEVCDVNDTRINSTAALAEFASNSIKKYFEAAKAENYRNAEYESISQDESVISESVHYEYSAKYLDTVGQAHSRAEQWRNLDFNYQNSCTEKLQQAGKLPK